MCLINFEYRQLTNKDIREYPVKTKDGKTKTTGITQDELNFILKDKILKSITAMEPKKFLLEEQNGKTTLEKHLYKYTRKITSDFFIHKNLKEFLEKELDYFIKTEVLDISSFDERNVTRANVVKNIGQRIIEFLSQIEEFQKMLWEKKKFILRTDYVITIDRVPENFYKEILENKEQLKEWQELGFDIPSSVSFLRKQESKLPVDTKYFSEDFKERLLEKLTEGHSDPERSEGEESLDDLIDGILIKSENWQALNLIAEKYKEKIKCIYIDPPYNTGSNEFLYKDKYQHSSWLAMVASRLWLVKILMQGKGFFVSHIDNNEVESLGILAENIFSDYDKTIITVITNPRGRRGATFSQTHEYLVFCLSP